MRRLAQLDGRLVARLEARGFDPERWLAWAASVGGAAERNILGGRLEPIAAVPRLDSAHRQLGEEALARGEVAVCVLAGGMATRMGGVVKALVEVAPGVTFLDLRLAEIAQLGRRYGKAPPFWLMTSEATDGPIRAALTRQLEGEGRAEVATFEQLVSLRMTGAGELFLDASGEPSVYATGHGDLPEALARSGLLQGLIRRGGRYLWISNLDNLGAGVDPSVLGQHIAGGGDLTVELVQKEPGDQGGGPVKRDGRPIIAEHFRLPRGFDHDAVPVFNTNTFVVGAGALEALSLDWTYLEVRKEVDGRTAVQFERLIGEMTEAIEPSFLQVPREGPVSRFLPVKSHGDLARLRPHVERLVVERGLRES